MFGNLFEEEEDFSFITSNPKEGNWPKSKMKRTQPPPVRGPTKLSGIKNQGGTCYLNSLLQTLLFTPEFREALFSLGTDELGSLADADKKGAKVRVIPLQLQRLFAYLLLVDQQTASTEDLTDSFGWNSRQERSQHDVQELNRILFSALEASLAGTSGHDLINKLYHGTVVNKIVCKECGNVSERQEDFLDLTVAVKDVSSLEEALWNMYVEEECFDADNLYRCAACNCLVRAVKSAKLRKLPPFLTFSLLRFNFDFVKCERYKEIGSYSFPMKMDLRPFCEQVDVDETEYEYELFSVIIHKGGCYGGHYHVYIKDVDRLGTWYSLDEELMTDSSVKDKKESTNQPVTDGPLTKLIALMPQGGSEDILVDQLGQKLLNAEGVSWNKKYRKQHGPIRKFLQNHPDIFTVSTDGNNVRLKPTAETKLDVQNMKSKNLQQNSKETLGSLNNACDVHWFDFNDSTVQPIKEKEIEKQFEGKESAYMLFYRKASLQRPFEAQENPRYKIPPHLLEDTEAINAEILKKRAEFDTETNNIDLHLHVGSNYKFENGALHPLSSRQESILDVTVDRRKTLGDLRQMVFQLLEFWKGDMALTVARTLPAGLHLYQTLSGEEQSLYSLGIVDRTDLFVWNGKEVCGTEILTGIDCEPVLLNILQVAKKGDCAEQSKSQETQQVFPCNAVLSSIQEMLATSLGVKKEQLSICTGSDFEESENWYEFSDKDMQKTIKELRLKNGACILVSACNGSSKNVPNNPRRIPTQSECSWLRIQNFLTGTYSNSDVKRVKIQVALDMPMFDIKSKAIQEMQLQHELVHNTCLRQVDENDRLHPPVGEDVSMREAKIKSGSTLGLCSGKAPTATQLFLYFAVSYDIHVGPEMEIVIEETVSVKECLTVMLKTAGLEGTDWHLIKMDWCCEDGDPLRDEDATLKELNICTGDVIFITEGRLPPKLLQGFLKIQIWKYQPFIDCLHQDYFQDSRNHITSQMTALNITPAGDATVMAKEDSLLYFAGIAEISGEATLAELKTQVMTLPSLQNLCVPSVEFLRIWVLEDKLPVIILRCHSKQLSTFKLGNNVEVGIQALQKEEDLSLNDLLLRIQMRIPGEREYYPAEEFVWDISKECTALALRQKIAAYYKVPVESIEIAKYLPEKFEWMPITSWTQQVSKRKKRKKQEGLQGAPYYLKDGDIIGVKNILDDDSKDFSTVRDDAAKEKLLQDLRGKQKSQGTTDIKDEDPASNAKTVAKKRKPEVALCINVDVFR
ncbi:ubiquitin carboxyl-terminal hydrolase 40 [Protopterus annectens]|uniref:ubiquitin carboxyl-terminal hydrolase 40 n=1 Tax=Protopterus annectens TaxID=7888 RepID=UPI001CFBD300|nr:ubiquitin carboxyl-terminal hydrolase 40 [Protopterus annectens]XP_043930983.1 ubiquitin carboxyl-terminal hydrolase 40 [Protopterus annectens]